MDALHTVARSDRAAVAGRPTVNLSGGRDLPAGGRGVPHRRGRPAAVSTTRCPGRPTSPRSIPGFAAARTRSSTPSCVSTPGTPAPLPSAIEAVDRVRRWHRYAEGLRPANYSWHGPPENLVRIQALVVGGMGGEIWARALLPAGTLPWSTRCLSTGGWTSTRGFCARGWSFRRGPADRPRAAIDAHVRHPCCRKPSRRAWRTPPRWTTSGRRAPAALDDTGEEPALCRRCSHRVRSRRIRARAESRSRCSRRPRAPSRRCPSGRCSPSGGLPDSMGEGGPGQRACVIDAEQELSSRP